MPRLMISCAFIIVCLSMACAFNSKAARAGFDGESTIVGVVTDDTGRPIPNAQVSLQGARLGEGRVTTTDKNGSYRFSRLPAGKGYELIVEPEGYSRTRCANLPLPAFITLRILIVVMGCGNSEYHEYRDMPMIDYTDAGAGMLWQNTNNSSQGEWFHK